MFVRKGEAVKNEARLWAPVGEKSEVLLDKWQRVIVRKQGKRRRKKSGR